MDAAIRLVARIMPDTKVIEILISYRTRYPSLCSGPFFCFVFITYSFYYDHFDNRITRGRVHNSKNVWHRSNREQMSLLFVRVYDFGVFSAKYRVIKQIFRDPKRYSTVKGCPKELTNFLLKGPPASVASTPSLLPRVNVYVRGKITLVELPSKFTKNIFVAFFRAREKYVHIDENESRRTAIICRTTHFTKQLRQILWENTNDSRLFGSKWTI